MNIFDLISQDEIDELPEDNHSAFMEFVRHCQRRLNERQRELDGNDEGQWYTIQANRQSFMNIVLAAARQFDIEPFASTPVPSPKSFKEETYDNFISDLDHFMTQLVLDRSIRGRRQSVQLSAASKDKIRSYLNGLRQVINGANLNDARREALLAKLNDFEAEVEKRRLNYLAVAWFTLEILALPGALANSYDVAAKLVTNIMQTVAEAKAVEDEQRRLPADQKPFALIPPRPPEPETGSHRDLDDEIPF